VTLVKSSEWSAEARPPPARFASPLPGNSHWLFPVCSCNSRELRAVAEPEATLRRSPDHGARGKTSPWCSRVWCAHLGVEVIDLVGAARLSPLPASRQAALLCSAGLRLRHSKRSRRCRPVLAVEDLPLLSRYSPRLRVRGLGKRPALALVLRERDSPCTPVMRQLMPSRFAFDLRIDRMPLSLLVAQRIQSGGILRLALNRAASQSHSLPSSLHSAITANLSKNQCRVWKDAPSARGPRRCGPPPPSSQLLSS
jgi:hypothetical protein